MRDFESVRRDNPADPDQLGALAMVLVRMDRAKNYAKLLDQVRAMGDCAIGYLLQKGLDSYYTPGLLRVLNEVEPGTIRANTLVLAEELSGCQDLDRLVSRRTTNENMIGRVRKRRADEPESTPRRVEKADSSGEGLIRRFYKLQQRPVETSQIEADVKIYDDLRASGYSPDEVLHAVGWTFRNIPSAKQFRMVKLCIAEALESRSNSAGADSDSVSAAPATAPATVT